MGASFATVVFKRSLDGHLLGACTVRSAKLHRTSGKGTQFHVPPANSFSCPSRAHAISLLSSEFHAKSNSCGQLVHPTEVRGAVHPQFDACRHAVSGACTLRGRRCRILVCTALGAALVPALYMSLRICANRIRYTRMRAITLCVCLETVHRVRTSAARKPQCYPRGGTLNRKCMKQVFQYKTDRTTVSFHFSFFL